MKKRILTGIGSIIFSFSLLAFPISVNANAERDDGTKYQSSLYLENNLPENQPLLSTDNSLFERFLKYSLYVTDMNSLTPEQLKLCRTVFYTERSSSQLLLCKYARETIKTGVAPARISLNDRRLLADMTGYNLIPFFPDISFYDLYAAYDFGQPSAINEYWTDDSGMERVIAHAGSGGPFYQIRFDKMPDPDEADRIVDYSVGNWLEQSDGGVLYAGDIQADRWIIDDNVPEIKNSGYWEYIVTDDSPGTAMITGCTLPTGSEAKPIAEPVILPEELDGYTVTGISATLSDIGITTLVIPESYTCVQRFINMPYLKKAEIYAPRLELKDGTFVSCPELESVSLHVKTIGIHACLQCPELKSVSITGADEISYCAFEGASALEEVSLPENLKYLGQDAFCGTSVTELVIPESTEIVGVLRVPYIQYGSLIDPLTADRILIADEGCVLKGYSDTEAQYYADANGYTFVPLDETAQGDINADGMVSVTDLVLLVRWLTGDSEAALKNWKSGDFNKDGVLNVVDLLLLKSALLDT